MWPPGVYLVTTVLPLASTVWTSPLPPFFGFGAPMLLSSTARETVAVLAIRARGFFRRIAHLGRVGIRRPNVYYDLRATKYELAPGSSNVSISLKPCAASNSLQLE